MTSVSSPSPPHNHNPKSSSRRRRLILGAASIATIAAAILVWSVGAGGLSPQPVTVKSATGLEGPSGAESTLTIPSTANGTAPTTTVASGPTTTSATTSGTSGTTAPETGVPPVAFSGVDWSNLPYPTDCGGQITGSAAAYGQPAANEYIAVVLVSCVAGAGSPPSAVFVFRAEAGQPPALLQQLLSYQDDWQPDSSSVAISGKTLQINVAGYSSNTVPRCCPDLTTALQWTWSGQDYVLNSPEPTHVTLPSPGTSGTSGA